MTGLEPVSKGANDKLDAVGNTAAIGKGFAIGSAALTALVLFAAFTTQAGITEVDILNPKYWLVYLLEECCHLYSQHSQCKLWKLTLPLK